MSNILILGGGISALRYIESLLFTNNKISICSMGILEQSRHLAMRFNLPLFEFSQISEKELSQFDLLILCIPPDCRMSILNKIINVLGYDGALIIEKPLTILEDELVELQRLLLPLKRCAVVCQRDFNLAKFRFFDLMEGHYSIVWGTPFTSFSDNLIHMFPHFFSWLLCEQIEIIKAKVLWDNCLAITTKRGSIELLFSQERHRKGVSINGKVFPSPEYRSINATIAEEVLRFTKKDTDENLRRAVAVSNTLVSLLKEVQI